MSGRIFSILLLIEVVSVSGALPRWFLPTIHYKPNKIGDLNGIRYELQSVSSKKQPQEKLNPSPNQRPSIQLNPWVSFFNHKTSTKSPELLNQNSEELTTPISLPKELLPSNPPLSKLRKHNPLCLFSALPCVSREKDVYYRLREFKTFKKVW